MLLNEEAVWFLSSHSPRKEYPQSVSLSSRNFEGCSRSKDKKVEKKIKISEEESRSVKSMGKEELLLQWNLEKVLRERDDLMGRLKIIEQIILSTKESDEVLVKKVRDYIGTLNQPASTPDLDESFNLLEYNDHMKEDESLLGKSASKQDLALLNEGESI